MSNWPDHPTSHPDDGPGYEGRNCFWCGAQEDERELFLDPESDDYLCGPCRKREAGDATPRPVVDPPTAPVSIHMVSCPKCGERLVTLALIEGGHTCRRAA